MSIRVVFGIDRDLKTVGSKQNKDGFEWLTTVAMEDLDRSEPREEAAHRPVVGEHERREARDAGVASPSGQVGDERAADAAASPAVDDGGGDLGGLRVLGRADVAGDADGTPVPIEGEQRLVAAVIGMREVVDLLCGEVADRGEEAPVARVVSEMGEMVEQQVAVVAVDRADPDRRSVGQPYERAGWPVGRR